jgi:formylglycine-generating enzyme required for sulfatase activity
VGDGRWQVTPSENHSSAIQRKRARASENSIEVVKPEAVDQETIEEYATPTPRIKWGLRLVIGIIAGVILVAAALIGILRGPHSPTANDNANVAANPPINMVRVHGGEFLMGSATGDEYEKPVHRVNVKSFDIDIYEVTCEDYLKFARATSHRIPANWVNGHYPDGAAKQPVTGVDWDDANAYARWIGKRLPTEEEWEFAARGADGRLYPWGNEWRSNVTNAGNSSAGRFTDVGSYPDGKSPFGIMDMVGNAWEWTASEWKGYLGGPVPADASNELRVIRGGFFGSSIPKATTTFRRGWDARGSKEGYRNTGFRCAKNL